MQKKPPEGPSPLPHCWCPQLCAKLYLPAVNIWIYKFRDSKGCHVAANFFASYASLHTVLVTLWVSGILSSARLPNTHTHTHNDFCLSFPLITTAGFCINECHRNAVQPGIEPPWLLPPCVFSASTSALRSHKRRTTSTWPISAAKCLGSSGDVHCDTHQGQQKTLQIVAVL